MTSPIAGEAIDAMLPGKASKLSPRAVGNKRPYRKPTQVGEERILRRLRELG